jgi:hypothetical protein
LQAVGRVGRWLRWTLLVLATAGAADAAPRAPAKLDPVAIDLGRQVNTVTPKDALGIALDGMEKGEVDLYLTPYNIVKMRAAGFRRVTYRTRPELGIEVWHWTEKGAWSDAARQQGYWTGDPDAESEPRLTWGYSLPRRGDTIDNATNVGYSRIDDGDPATFWKSNPYLDRRYTGLAESRPQWIVVSFGKPMRIDAARIAWGAPFARHFLVQYWSGDDAYVEGKQTADSHGRWTTFAHGDVTVAGAPDSGVLRLADAPIAVHFVRILMLASSEAGPPGSTDIRDSLGYAVREVSLGVAAPDGRLVDAVRHGRTKDNQTVVQVSSTDPWHRAVDRDPGTEQPSLDLVYGAGLGGDQPLMIPVGSFYDTPENAAAEIRFVRRKGWPVRMVELGEEPDGQFIRPEDYADAYLETAKAVHGVDPSLLLGGPSMQGALTGTWPDTEQGTSWTGRFVAELKARGSLGELQFFSFEHYVFDDVCRPIGGLLRDETDVLDHLVSEVTASGMPRTIPWVISEYGASPFAGEAQSDIPSALLGADIVGHFLTLGGDAAFMFGYTPDQPANQNFPCAGYGNMMLWEADDGGRSKWPMPSFYLAQMMMNDWGAPADAPHRLYLAASSLKDEKGRPYVVAYPLLAPDGRWSVMLVNRDQFHAHATPITFTGAFKGAGGDAPFGAGAAVDVVQYSSAQYVWRARGEAGYPTRDLPPARFALAPGRTLVLPALSLTVVSGQGPAPTRLR